jgi:hypothetical protein
MFVLSLNEDVAHLDGLRMVFDNTLKRFIPFQAGVHTLPDIVGIQVSELASFVIGTQMDLNSLTYSYYTRNHLGECIRDVLGNPIVNPTPPPEFTYTQRVATIGEVARMYTITLETATAIAPVDVDPATLVFLQPVPGTNIPATWKILESGVYTTPENETYNFWSVLVL